MSEETTTPVARRKLRVGLIDRQQPFLEWNPIDQCWRIWTHYNKDVSEGTYFNCYGNGVLDRVTSTPHEKITVRYGDESAETLSQKETKDGPTC